MMTQTKRPSGYTTIKTRSLDDQLSFRDRIDSVKQIIDPAFLLEQLGFTVESESTKEIRAACLIHGGDNTTSFRVNKELNTWVCFSHKCHETYGNDLFGLVRAINKCTFMQALEFLEDLTGSRNVSRDKLILYKQRKEKQEFIRQSNIVSEKSSIVNESRLKFYKPYRSSLFLIDGFKEETLDYFEVAGGYSDKDGLLRDIIPIRNHKGDLVAYSLRDIRRNVEYHKKYKLTPGFDKDTVLYNLNNIKDLIQEKILIIVEGFKSVWRLYELGIKNVVACMGSGITTGQVNLLCTYAHQGVCFFFDNDYAGASAIGRSFDLLNGKMPLFVEIITEVNEDGEGLDPAELTDEQIFYYMKDYM
jgi:hypothetical protein